jgi:hypothetical protein
MRIQTEYMSFNNCWTISSSYSRRTSSVPKEDVLFPRLLYCESWCSQTCRWRSQVFPGLLSPLPVTLKAGRNTLLVVLATGPGNPPAVQVWTGKTIRFVSRTVKILDPEILGVPNPYPYPSTHGFCRVWLDPSGPISGFHFPVFLFMVAVWYVTAMCNICTLVHHSLYLFCWLPLWAK